MIYKQQFLITPPDIDRLLATKALEIAEETNRCAGIIVAMFVDNAPVRYVDADGIDWKFGDENHGENPKVYLTMAGAKRKCDVLNQEAAEGIWEGVWRPEFWVHEDIGLTNLSKYVKMTGGRFHGTPRQ